MANDDDAHEAHGDGGGGDGTDDLRVRVQNLQAKVDQAHDRRIETLEEMLEEQAAVIDDLQARLDDAEDRVETLEEKFSGLAGLKEHEQTTAEKRREDLVLALQRRAEDGVGKDGNGLASMTYEDVLNLWASLNHGQLDPKQAYRAMEQVAEIPGITLTTNEDDQKVVRFNRAKYDPSTASGVVDDVNNGREKRTPKNAVSPSD